VSQARLRLVPGHREIPQQLEISSLSVRFPYLSFAPE